MFLDRWQQYTKGSPTFGKKYIFIKQNGFATHIFRKATGTNLVSSMDKHQDYLHQCTSIGWHGACPLINCHTPVDRFLCKMCSRELIFETGFGENNSEMIRNRSGMLPNDSRTLGCHFCKRSCFRKAPRTIIKHHETTTYRKTNHVWKTIRKLAFAWCEFGQPGQLPIWHLATILKTQHKLI